MVGIKNIWITPFFKSPMIDHGYDISDYYDIDPLFGDFDEFKVLIAKIKSLGMHLIIDIVPNHTSDQHKWFQASIKCQEPYKDYYIWHNGGTDPTTGEKLVPNNWTSCFRGPAWTWHPERQQFYMNTFHPQQPNLNCRNPKVIAEIFNILKFWIDQGVDGVRIDAVKHLIYDDKFRNNFLDNSGVIQRFDWEQPELYNLVNELTTFLRSYGRQRGRHIVSMTEAYTNLYHMKKYYSEGKVDMPFNFCLVGWKSGETNNAPHLKRIVQETLAICQEAGSWPNWVLDNHDTNRIASRLESEKNPAMVDLANMLLLLLPGTPVCYYGDELGMPDVEVPYDKCKDVRGITLGPDCYKQRSRDPFRAPMVWDDSPNGGFGASGKDVEPWLPVLKNFQDFCVKRQQANPNSHLNFFRRLLKFRHSQPIFCQNGLNLRFHNFDDTLDEKQRQNILIFTRDSSPLDDFSHDSTHFLIILHLDSQSADEKSHLNLAKLIKSDNIRPVARLIFRTPNLVHLQDNQLVWLKSVPICGLQGMILELKTIFRERSQSV